MTLVDTNTIVHYIKGNPGVVRSFQATARGQLAVPSIVVYELEHGTLRNPKRRSLVNAVLRELEVIPFDVGAALEAAKIHAELELKGELIGPMDLLIAGVARHSGATLVSNNVNEFVRVKGLKTVDWRTE